MKITKEQMMTKAIELFQNEGFENVPVERICQACDVTKGSFYHHFASKNDILLDFYNETSAYALSMTQELLSITSPIEQLWRVLEYSIDDTIRLGPDLLKHMLILDIQRGNHLLNPYSIAERNQYHSLLISIIERGQQCGEIRQGNAKDLLFAYISGLLGVALNWSASGGAFDEKAELHRLFGIIFMK